MLTDLFTYSLFTYQITYLLSFFVTHLFSYLLTYLLTFLYTYSIHLLIYLLRSMLSIGLIFYLCNPGHSPGAHRKRIYDARFRWMIRGAVIWYEEWAVLCVWVRAQVNYRSISVRCEYWEVREWSFPWYRCTNNVQRTRLRSPNEEWAFDRKFAAVQRWVAFKIFVQPIH